VARAAELLAAQGEARPALAQAWLDDAHGTRFFPGTPPRESVIGPPLTLRPGTEPLTAEGIKQLRPKRTVRPVSYYDGRAGYDPRFLGVKIPLPTLTERALRFGAPAAVAGAGQGDAPGELKYTHFSVVFNATRRLAFYTAVNVDGKQWQSLSRGDDAWYFDPRLPFELQVADELYGNEPEIGGRKNWFDRGHLVRRLDPVWGPLQIAAQADEDTFHWTNCSPQYWAFNQGTELWQGLENYVLYNTDQEDIRACIFTGPLFQADDELHRDVYIPQSFWKVIVVRDAARTLYSSAYVVGQQKFARNVPFEQLPVGDFNNFQVPLARLQAQTGLSFSRNVREADVLKGATEDRPLRSLADVIHPRR
jgi:endonuclease G